MSSAPHENVRLLVSQAVLNILNGLISKKIRAEGYNARLAVLKKFIESHKGSPESIIMLMPQEVRVGGEERFRVDMVIGSKIAFDFKSSKSEFDAAVDAAKTKYLPHLPRVSYYVITNWSSWRFYRVIRRGDSTDLRLVVEGEKDAAIAELEKVLAREIEELKVPPHPDVIATLYSIDIDESRRGMMSVLNSVLKDRDVAPLFEAYKKVMETLYPQRSPDFVKELYVNHTLMHMMVMASLSAVLNRSGTEIDICSGSALPPGLDVALPYLNWWKIALDKMSKEHQEMIRRIANDIVVKAYMVDWDLDSSEDVFRVLYELLVEPHVRRSIGEYYTPIWLVDRILSEFTLKDKLVMDPFCGSGTFLVRAFHKKVMEGEDADSAYEEVVGFDINPLAVAVARAELVISYVRAMSKEPKTSLRLPSTPPRVYHTDTLAAWFGGGSFALSDPNYSRIVESLEAHISAKVKLEIANKLANIKPKDALSAVSSFEHLLAVGIPIYMRDEDFENKLADHILNGLREDNPIESILREAVLKNSNSFMSNLAALVKRYGDGVWAAVLSSAASLALLNAIRPHVIVTNPPWINMTEYKTGYAGKFWEVLSRKILVNSLKIIPKKASGIVTGSDVAIAALYKALSIARDGVGFVMSRKQAFYSKASVNAGIVATYAVLKSTCADCLVKLIDVDYDAFGHGVYPALVIALKGKEKKVELYVLKVEDGSIPKEYDITKVKPREVKLNMSYEDYMRPAVLWATEDAKSLAKALDVVRVATGDYVRGLFGGEKKSGSELYAGLVVSDLKPANRGFYIRLFNTDKEYMVPSELMRRYGIGIYKIYYRGRINPFKCSTLDVILSSIGEDKLKAFIGEVIRINRKTMTEGDERRLRRLSEEVKARVKVLSDNSHYVIYRGKGVFTACVPEDLSKSITESATTHLECWNAEQAHYYSAILNYMAYKVVSKGREFIRDQYTKPSLAIVVANLTWKDLPPQLKGEIAMLSHALSKKLTWIDYPNQRKAILETAKMPEFAQIIELVDKHIESAGKQSRLEEALELVSGVKEENDEDD
ncbi:MAG: N-6 DNA methylase [Acidilobaceae archaeon]|nr:N-6 DNA methylase [Acidilobaceae archaeon]MDW7973721.1 N-6 DNA methylase [Sulfolobales archaeon]